MGFSVGIGLTNNCNLACAHCYRDTLHIDNITLEQIRQICETVPVDAMGMGTGENVLNPEFIPIVNYLQEQRVKLSVASNGYTLTAVPREVLQAFHDVEVSIDFPTQAEQDAFRGEGNWSLVHRAIERCKALGVEVSILTTLMHTNFNLMDRMVWLARANEVNLRMNVYQPVKTDLYRLTYDEFWEGYRLLFAEGLVVSCSEPVVRAVMNEVVQRDSKRHLNSEPQSGVTGVDGKVQSPCGRNSIRFNPRGQIIPCVYWPLNPLETLDISELVQNGHRDAVEFILSSPAFEAARREPESASRCPCRGGCASRRALNHSLDAHDEYCPWVRGDSVQLDWQPAPAKDLMRSSNVCTTVVV